LRSANLAHNGETLTKTRPYVIICVRRGQYRGKSFSTFNAPVKGNKAVRSITKRSLFATVGFAAIALNTSSRINPKQHAVIVGTTLGDGHLQLALNQKSARLRCTHSRAQKQYVDWLYRKQLSTLCEGVKPPYDTEQHGFPMYEAYTRYSEQLKPYHTTFYQPTNFDKPKYRKSVPDELSSILTDPLSLMVWYLDDGTLRKDSGACRLATQCFTGYEHIILQECLVNNFGVKTKIERWSTGFELTIPTRGGHAQNFISLFEDVVLEEIPSMSYKIRRM